jgi:hypothetical protein
LAATVRQSSTNLTVNSPLIVKYPDGTTTNVSETVTLQYGILDVWNDSVLYLKTLNSNGNCEPKVTVAAREAVEIDGDVTAEESVSLTTVAWAPGEEMKKAWRRCNSFYAQVNDTFWYLTEKLSDFKNRPDPTPSERSVREVAQVVAQVQKAVALYAQAGSQTEAEVWRQLGEAGGLRSADPALHAVDLTRLRLRNVVQTGETG